MLIYSYICFEIHNLINSVGHSQKIWLIKTSDGDVTEGGGVSMELSFW